jgi:PAS domain S-box-containing protein
MTETRTARPVGFDAMAVLDGLMDAVVGFDGDGRIGFWNRGAEVMFGRSRESVLGVSVWTMLESDARPRDGGRAVELVAVLADGTKKVVEAVFGSVGGGLGTAVLRDVQGRRHLELATVKEAEQDKRLANLVLDIAKLGGLELDDFQRRLTELVAEGLHADRVSIWRLRDGAIHCSNLFTRADGAHTSGLILTKAMFPPYFEGLERDECIVADDARNHPVTACFKEVYLEPLGIWSMLDTPLRSLNAGVRGVICVETFEARAWRKTEVRFCEDAAFLLVQAIEKDARRRLEEQHLTVLASIGDAVIATDTHGTITMQNPMASSLLGCHGCSMVGQSIFELFTATTDENDWALSLEMTSVKSAAHVSERRAILKGCKGQERPIVFSMAPIEQGLEMLGVVLTFRDITEEEKVRREIEQQNQRLRSIGHALPDLLFAVSTNGRVEYAQDANRPDLLKSAAELKNENLHTLFEPELANRLLTAVRNAVGKDEIERVEYALELPIGRQLFEARMARMNDDEAMVIVRNVNEERERSKALEEERARLEAVLASTSAIIYVAKLPGFEIEYVSESARDVLGFPPEEMMVPGFWEQAVHPDDMPRIMAELGGLFERGRHAHEYRHRGADGSYRWLRDDLRLIRDSEGRPIRAVGASFDITERKVGELRLHAMLTIRKLVSRASKGFLETHGTVPDEVLLETLAGIGVHTRADRAYVFKVSGGLVSNTHEWCKEGVKAEIENLQNLPEEAFSFFMAPIQHGAPLWIPSVANLPEEAAAEKEILSMQGIETLLAVPLRVEGAVIGFVGVDNPVIEPMEPMEFAGLMQLFADTIAAGLQRSKDEQALRALNDELTRKTELKRRLLSLSNALALAETRDEIFSIIRAHIREMIDANRVSLMEVSEDRDRVDIEFISKSGDEDESTVRFVTSSTQRVTIGFERLTGSAPSLAFETGKTISTRDHEPMGFPDWVHFFETQGLNQFAVVPMKGPHGVIGTLNIGMKREHPPGVEELEIAEQLTTTLAAHLSILRAREALQGLNVELEKRVEERTLELRASETRFERLFLDAPQAMLIADSKHKVLQSNLNARKLFGYGEEEFFGLPVGALVPPTTRPHHESLMDGYHIAHDPRAMAKGRVVEAVRKDGSTFFGEIGLVPLEVADGLQVLAGITDISERLLAEAAISDSLREKETLLKEIHHRVKNNLQIISSLLMLQSDQMPSEQGRKLLEESVYRVRSMALIHEQLYGVESLQFIDLGDYARVLSDSLRATVAPKASIEVRASVVEVTVELAVPLGLILNELLTNAFKYGIAENFGPFAGPRRTEADVLIEIGVENDRIRMSVTDSGPGLPPEFDPKTSPTLGLQLVRSLNRQLRGELAVDVDNGTRFVIRCPRE